MAVSAAALFGLQVAFSSGLSLDDYMPFGAELAHCRALSAEALGTPEGHAEHSDRHARAGHCLRLALPRDMPCPGGRAGASTQAAMDTLDQAVLHLSRSENPLDLAYAEHLPDQRHEIANRCAMQPHFGAVKAVRHNDALRWIQSRTNCVAVGHCARPSE